ncbi:probable LRR receptor-like serine/threonine-protein kinase At3g47570 isoform X2 [Rosa rugosa]|uniref:probable LRR receptor-like serine/threonine-protein kinase At3g47570 isoform X2 n=1 Tax=Rosa rugosa TaxID=74645 RepID=UPI002B408CE5|nr:probable LRR receptor-like serine/threonine-protein kinase At3g47570 isoform X2 [Rosa rugosa]
MNQSTVVLHPFDSMQLNHPRLEGNETDRLALLAIKAQIQHDPNQVTSSWNETLHFCLWHGVTCSRRHRQRVTKLELGSQALGGSISPHIGNLSFLRVLILENNSFTHQIPPQIGNLHRLQVMHLNNNSLTGTIPANISNCIKLISLSLSKTNLVGKIPPKLGSLSKLQNFSLNWNNLTGVIPPSLGNLSSLEGFSVIENKLEGSIPSSLCQLKRLISIYLESNRLSGIIPSCIYNLSSIAIFAIGGNQIQGSLPSNLSNAFPNLQIFTIAENQFTGAIPSSISKATNLVWFQCPLNKLSGQVPNLRNLHNIVVFNVYGNNLGSSKDGDLSFVSELINATQLIVLDFGQNNFGGTLPKSISNLSTNLQLLSVGGNQLQGSIPTGLGNLVNLQALVMEGNSFKGSIPTYIGQLSRLGRLYLNNNQLSGSIPSSLGNLTLLTVLQLQENNLKGSIPSSLGKCHWLNKLVLSGNNLNGTIPPQVIGLSSLSRVLALDRNQFTGSLPMGIGKLKNLGVLDVSDNLLSGELPSSLGTCESLEELYLQGNFFLGPIPSSMKDLRGIQNLDLSRNNLSGNIPQFLENMNLQYLNLSFNQFWGAVPTGGVFKNASATSVAGNARLCGGIPSLRLPLCKLNQSKREGMSRRMKLMISLVSGFSLLGLVVVLSLFLLGKKRKKTNLSTLENSVLQVSYATLLRATDGFSSANLIGVGAFGFVYKGILTDDRVVVAVKVLNMLHRGAANSFMAECEALRNIRHRNLVKILTACSSIDFGGNDFKALVEFMDNGSLEEWLHPSTGTGEVTEAPKTLSLTQRLNIAIDVASALDYLHNHCETPIVHCDLKPSNVLLDGDLTGHVSDFGLSRFLSEPTMSVSGNQLNSIGIRGSVGYAAPEYGMGSEVSTYGDVYSFGILLLEMFTGKRPTDYMFSDSLNLHNCVKTTLPELVSEISKSLVFQEGTTNVAEAHRHSRLSVRAQKIEECLTLILGIGIACSVESPTNRKDISDVASELQFIRRNLLN